VKFSELFKNSYLKAADLGGKPRRYTIKSIELEEVGKEKETKPVMRFDEIEGALVLNKTNGTTLREAFGDDAEDWPGNEVLLKPDKTDFGGKRVDCIRVAVPTKKAPSPVEQEEEAFDDINV